MLDPSPFMQFFMRRQQTRLSKAASAPRMRAYEGFIPDVDVNVLQKVLLAGQFLLTNGTGVSVMTQVDYFDVTLQVVFGGKMLGTLRDGTNVTGTRHFY